MILSNGSWRRRMKRRQRHSMEDATADAFRSWARGDTMDVLAFYCELEHTTARHLLVLRSMLSWTQDTLCMSILCPTRN